MSITITAPTSSDITTVNAKIGLQDYALRVSKASEQEVNEAIALVSQRFDAVSKAGKISNPERIAVMVALNLAVEMNKNKQVPAVGFDFPNTDIASLRQHIGQILKN
jgi:cell division protein ZapA (FtsZ GTPase activity inhibitor)